MYIQLHWMNQPDDWAQCWILYGNIHPTKLRRQFGGVETMFLARVVKL